MRLICLDQSELMWIWLICLHQGELMWMQLISLSCHNYAFHISSHQGLISTVSMLKSVSATSSTAWAIRMFPFLWMQCYTLILEIKISLCGWRHQVLSNYSILDDVNITDATTLQWHHNSKGSNQITPFCDDISDRSGHFLTKKDHHIFDSPIKNAQEPKYAQEWKDYTLESCYTDIPSVTSPVRGTVRICSHVT